MIKLLIIFPISFSIWYGLVKLFSKNDESSINVLLEKVLNDISQISRNIIDLFDALFKSFIEIYELLGSLIKNIVGIFKSLIYSIAKIFKLIRIISITLMSFINLSKGLYKETKNINLLDSLKGAINQTKSAKNKIVKLFNFKGDDLNNKELFLKR